jgi:hypothetical protein
LVPVLSSHENKENISNVSSLTTLLEKNPSDFTNHFNKQYYDAWERIFIKQHSTVTTQMPIPNSSKDKLFSFTCLFGFNPI